MALLEWHGAGGFGAATTTLYFFFGGVLMVVGGFLEFILGNTFPSVVFTMFGAFWLAFGGTLQPFYNAAKLYDPTAPQAMALQNPEFANTFAFFMVYMGVLCFIFLITSIRTSKSPL
jgi:succinate-acetate transporter protein